MGRASVVIRVAIALGALGAMLAGPSDVAAFTGTSGGLKYVTVSRHENGGAAVFGEQAECGPDQWVATGGGAGITGAALGQDRWVIGTMVGLQEVPRRPDMIESAFNAGPARTAATIAAYAICKKRSPGRSIFTPKPNGFDYTSGDLRYVHREGHVSPGASAIVKASCGARALSGGTTLAFMDHGFMNLSEPLDEPTDNDLARNDAWRGLFHDLDDVGATTQAEAICAASNSPFAAALRYRQSPATTLPAGQVKSVTAACGHGQVVTGGGVLPSGAGSAAAVTQTVPADLRDPDRIPDDGWRGTFVNLSGAAKTVTTFAICKQP